MSYFFIFLKLYAKNSFTCPNIMSINFVLASTLAHAICGVIKSFPLSLIFLRGLSTLIGSFVNTSRPAAAISPVSNASYKSCSTTIGPLQRFRNIAFFFIFANASRFISPSVYSLSGACTDTISDVDNNVSKSTCSYPSCAGLPDAE